MSSSKVDKADESSCQNCGAPADANFCPNCGQKTRLQRISLTTLLQETSANVFQINRGLFYSIIEFTRRPAISVENYLSNKRKQYLQPVAYAFTLASFYFLLSRLVDHNTYFDSALEGFVLASSDMENDKLIIERLTWFTRNYAFTALLMVPFFSLATFLVFINEKRNYLEHVVLNLYITGHQSLIYAFFAIASVFISNADLVEILTLFFSVAYAVYVLLTFFKAQHLALRLIKVMLGYGISLTLLVISIGAIGLVYIN